MERSDEHEPKWREPRTESVAVRVSKRELAMLEAAASREGQTLRGWIREQLLRSAPGSNVNDLLLTELTGLHMLLQSSLRSIHPALGLSVAGFDAKLLDIRNRKHAEAEALRSRQRVPLNSDPEAMSYLA